MQHSLFASLMEIQEILLESAVGFYCGILL